MNTAAISCEAGSYETRRVVVTFLLEFRKELAISKPNILQTSQLSYSMLHRFVGCIFNYFLV